MATRFVAEGRRSARRMVTTLLAGALTASLFAAQGHPLEDLAAPANDNGFGLGVQTPDADSQLVTLGGIGDVFGNGQDDLAIGIPNGGGNQSGAFYAYPGPMTGVDFIDVTDLTTNPTVVPTAGSGTNQRLANSLTGCGDVNGDGYPDMAAGPNGNPGSSSVHNGYVFFGGPGGITRTMPPPSGQGFAIRGIDTDDTSNITSFDVKGAGDVNADGFGDLVIRVVTSQSGLPSRLFVVFCDNNTGNFRLGQVGNTVPGFVINGPGPDTFYPNQPGEPTQNSFGPAGDVNGDAFADIIVGFKVPGVSAGEAAVVFGKNDNVQVDLAALDVLSSGFYIKSPVPDLEADIGYAVAGVGDMDGDGDSEVLVGTPRLNSGFGAAFLVRGQKTKQIIDLGQVAGGTGGYLLEGDKATTGTAGLTLAGAGDVDGDGVFDLLIGAPHSQLSPPPPPPDNPDDPLPPLPTEGAAFFVYGSTTNDHHQLEAIATDNETSPTWGMGGRYYFGTNPNDQVGRGLAGLGDLDGDDAADYGITSRARAFVSSGIIDTGSSTATNYSRPFNNTATYTTFTIPNRGLTPIGVTNGVQETYGFSRASVATHYDPAVVVVRRLEATLERSGANISNLDSFAEPIDALWKLDDGGVSPDPSSYTIQLHYHDRETSGAMQAREEITSIFQAASPGGPWKRIAPTFLDVNRNIVRTDVATLGYFTVGVRTVPPNKTIAPTPFVAQVVTVPNIMLEWHLGAQTNEVDVYFGPAGAMTYQGTTTGSEWFIAGLVSDANYEWRIDARNEVGVTTGDVWKFRTAPCRLPTINTPNIADGATVPVNPQLLAWNTTFGTVTWLGPGCTRNYIVHLGTSNPPGGSRDAGTNTSISIDGNTVPGRTYYWQVEVTDNVTSNFSPVWKFTVKKPTAGDLMVMTPFSDVWLSHLNAGAYDPPARLNYTGFRHDPVGTHWATQVGDFNRDKALDIVTITEFGDAWICLYDSTTKQLGPSIKQSGGWRIDPQAGYFAVAGDFSGDGRTDLVQVNPDGQVFLSKNAAGSLPAATLASNVRMHHNVPEGLYLSAADINGDGFCDLVEIDNLAGRINVALGNANGFEPRQAMGVWVYRQAPEEKTAVHFADLNGDARLDALQVFDGQMHVGFNNGTSFNEPIYVGSAGFHDDPSLGDGWWIFIADVNQDGRDDLVQINEFGETWVAPSKGDGGFDPPAKNTILGFHHKPDGPWQMFVGDGGD